jgi:hypothetical protein
MKLLEENVKMCGYDHSEMQTIAGELNITEGALYHA